MEYEEFVQEVRQRTGLISNWEAADAARAVVETLSECLPGVLASEVAARLPRGLRTGSCSAEWTPGEQLTGSGERLTVAEFVRRIAQREGILELTAVRHAQAVLPLVGASLGFELLERVRTEMPPEFAEFWAAGAAQAHMHQPVA